MKFAVYVTSGYERFEPGEHVGACIGEFATAADAAMVAGAEVLTRDGDAVVHIAPVKQS